MKIKLNKNLDRRAFGSYTIKDTDKDKVYDVFDCRPFDPRFHAITPSKTMQERLKKLPIYFAVDIRGHKYYHLEDKKVPKEIEILRQRFLSMIKKRPEIVGEIERKRPRGIVFTRKGFTEPGEDELYGMARDEWWRERRRATEKGKVPGKHVAIVRLISEKGHPYRGEAREQSAGTAIHELEHVGQFERWKGKPELQKRMGKGKYEKRKEEVLARKAEERAEKKRYKVGALPPDDQIILENLPKEYREYFMEHPEEFEKFKKRYKTSLESRHKKFTAGMQRVF